MRILIIEDDRDIRNSLTSSLRAESYTIDTAKDGEEGSYMARTNDYDLIILDLILPKKDGCKICKELRKNGTDAPILMISVNAASERKADLLNCGVDDYMTKPFSYVELLARIRALLRRPRRLEPEIFEIEDLIIDTARQHVERAGKEIYLTRKEFSLLEYLARNKGNVVSRGMIMEHVWNADTDPFSNTIEAHILNLRRKIELPKTRKLIKTVPGRGYKLDIE